MWWRYFKNAKRVFDSNKDTKEVDLSKTWEEVDWLTIREEMANATLHNETVLITEEERRMYPSLLSFTLQRCLKKRAVRSGMNSTPTTRPTSLRTEIT